MFSGAFIGRIIKLGTEGIFATGGIVSGAERNSGVPNLCTGISILDNGAIVFLCVGSYDFVCRRL